MKAKLAGLKSDSGSPHRQSHSKLEESQLRDESLSVWYDTYRVRKSQNSSNPLQEKGQLKTRGVDIIVDHDEENDQANAFLDSDSDCDTPVSRPG